MKKLIPLFQLFLCVLKSKLKTEENPIYKFDDERYPVSKASCTNSAYKDVTVTSQFDNVLNPPNPNGSTMIDVDVVLDKIKDLDLDLSTYWAKGTLSFVWCDPRLKLSSGSGKYSLTNDDAAVVLLKYAKIWTPEIRFRNGFAPREPDNIRIYNFTDGTILYREVFKVQLKSKFDLWRIPFDTERLNMEIGSLTFDDQYVKIMEEDETVAFSKSFNVPEFNLTGAEQKLTTYEDPFTKRNYSVLNATIVIQRDWTIYVLKIILPMYLLIFIISLIFKYPNENLHDRIDIALNCMLAAIAYQIVVEEKIPKYLFFNLLNAAVFASIVVMAVAILVVFLLFKCVDKGYKAEADDISEAMIYWYNLLYLIVLLDSYFLYIWSSKWSFLLTIGFLSYITYRIWSIFDEHKTKREHDAEMKKDKCDI